MLIGKGRSVALFVLTLLFHLIGLLYFVITVMLPDWADEYTQTQTFDEAMAGGLKLLVLLAPVAITPVGWLLNPESPVAIPVGASQSRSQS
jgi:hypothetical protein